MALRPGAVDQWSRHGPGLARLYSALVEPGRLLSGDLLDEATRVQSEGPCPVLAEDVAFGLGFVPTSERRPLGPNPRAFGHFGTGGAVGFGDRDAAVGFGYVMNHVIPRWQSTRNRTLIAALYHSLWTGSPFWLRRPAAYLLAAAEATGQVHVALG